MADIREVQRAWLRAIMERFDTNSTGIARRAGVAPSTVNRFYRDQIGSALSARTIGKICEAFGVGPPVLPGQPGGGAVDQDCLPVEFDEIESLARLPGGPLARLAQALAVDGDELDLWQVTGPALSALGYLPGDYIVTMPGMEPARGQPVVAMAESIDTPGKRRVLRLYEPPFLIAPSAEAGARKPLALDDARITLLGAVVASFRLSAAESLRRTA